MAYAYFQAVNESRLEEVLDYFHEDAVLLVPAQLPKVGREAIARFYDAFAKQFPESHHADVPLLMVDDDRVMTLVDMHGVDCDGNEVHLWASVTFTIEAGKIRHQRVLFDTAQLRGPVPPGVG
jgi:uncharacterized protein (TIGR02246 family)